MRFTLHNRKAISVSQSNRKFYLHEQTSQSSISVRGKCTLLSKYFGLVTSEKATRLTRALQETRKNSTAMNLEQSMSGMESLFRRL